LNPWRILGRERAPRGGELVLYQRGNEFSIRVDGYELMTSRACHSEQEMARLAVERLGDRLAGPRLLIGGLGMGFTARAALDALPPGAHVAIAEIVPAVVAWNHGPLAHLAQHPLADPRVQVDLRDVRRVIANACALFDAILLDVDNGPRGLTREDNQGLYTDAGLASARRALRPGGLLVVWSASPDTRFEKRLRQAGYAAEALDVPARGRGATGTRHTIFFGRTPVAT
jgi:spermidine synthase